MRADHEGVVLTKPELGAAIAAALPSSKTLNAVAFESLIATVVMYASDGRLAVQATGENDGLHPGKWRVSLAFLEMVHKSMGAKDLVRLCFSGESLHEAVVLDVLEEMPELVVEEAGTITWHTDAADHQEQFPFDTLEGRFRENSADRGVPAPVAPRYYEVLAKVGKCGIHAFERCPGRRRLDSPVYDTAVAANGTRWACLTLPCKVEELKAQNADDDRQLNLAVADSAKRLRDTLDEAGTTMTVSAGGKSVTVGGKKRGKKKVEATAS